MNRTVQINGSCDCMAFCRSIKLKEVSYLHILVHPLTWSARMKSNQL